jgi:hypothetical protein
MHNTFRYYKPFAQKCFEYFSKDLGIEGYKFIVCKYDEKGGRIGCHNKRNKEIRIFINQILSHKQLHNFQIKTIICANVLHELAHTIQTNNHRFYKYDKIYKAMIEFDVNLISKQYLIKNRDIIREELYSNLNTRIFKEKFDKAEYDKLINIITNNPDKAKRVIRNLHKEG